MNENLKCPNTECGSNKGFKISAIVFDGELVSNPSLSALKCVECSTVIGIIGNSNNIVNLDQENENLKCQNQACRSEKGFRANPIKIKEEHGSKPSTIAVNCVECGAVIGIVESTESIKHISREMEAAKKDLKS